MVVAGGELKSHIVSQTTARPQAASNLLNREEQRPPRTLTSPGEQRALREASIPSLPENKIQAKDSAD